MFLASAWRDHVEFPWNEYGVGMRNLAEGIAPPFTGSFDNWFTCGEGAAIRSELWACLAPGAPDLAAAYSYEDACFDHDGDGIWAPVFLARLQSLAFIESDPDKLIDGALAGVPSDSEISHVVIRARELVRSGRHWQSSRAAIVAEFGNSDFTDVRVNTGFVIIGWLTGNDFEERICITNNCGADTDSSTATIGALLGILDPNCIPERWLAPIGRDLVLNEEITGISPPPTLDEFTDLVVDLAERLGGREPEPTATEFDPAAHRIAVDIAWTNTAHESWELRDLSELPPEGSGIPKLRQPWQPAALAGTWTRISRDDFEDRILMVRLRYDARGRENVRLMFNTTEHFRIWNDGEYLHGSQGTQRMFPAPHMAPVGQFIDFAAEPGVHELVVAVTRPPENRPLGEWVIALVEGDSKLWIENAFRISGHEPAADAATFPSPSPNRRLSINEDHTAR